MTFTDFNNNGFRMLSPEIVSELEALGKRHGLNFQINGGQLGSDSIMFKLHAKTADVQAVGDAKKRDFEMKCRRLGLEPSDYGIVFFYNNKRWRLEALHPSRPKYAFEAVDLGSGQTRLLPKYAERNIVDARKNQGSLAPSSASLTAAHQPTNTGGFDSRYADLAQF